MAPPLAVSAIQPGAGEEIAVDQALVLLVEVPSDHVGLLYVDGVLQRQLEAGRYGTALVLGVEQSSITWRDQVVYENEKRDESIAFILRREMEMRYVLAIVKGRHFGFEPALIRFATAMEK